MAKSRSVVCSLWRKSRKFKPLTRNAKLLYLYLLKRGFLDGRAGLTYCMLQAIYEYHICIKVRELKRQEAGLPPS